MKRIIIFIIVLLMIPFASAQDDTPQVEVIPITSSMTNIDLSSNGRTVAFFDMGFMQNDEIVMELLPTKLIDIETGELDGVLFRGSDYTRAIAMSPDGTRLATTEFDGDLFIWDVSSGDLIKEINGLPGQNIMTFIDNNHLATVGGGVPSVIVIWDIELGHIVQIIPPGFDSRLEFTQDDAMMMQARNVTTMLAQPETNSLIIATNNDDLYTIDLETGDRQLIRTTGNELPMLSIRRIIPSQDGNTLYYISNVPSDEITAYQLDLETGEETVLLALDEEARLVTIGVDGAHDRLLWIEQTDGVNTLWMDSLSNPGDPMEIVVPDDMPEDVRMIGPDVRILFTADGNTAIIGGFMNRGGNDNALLKVTFEN